MARHYCLTRIGCTLRLPLRGKKEAGGSPAQTFCKDEAHQTHQLTFWISYNLLYRLVYKERGGLILHPLSWRVSGLIFQHGLILRNTWERELVKYGITKSALWLTPFPSIPTLFGMTPNKLGSQLALAMTWYTWHCMYIYVGEHRLFYSVAFEVPTGDGSGRHSGMDTS